MIVFTAKNQITGNVFVGSAKESVEDHWAQLIVLADEGASGEVLEMIREFGSEAIEIETWDYADSPSESRLLIRDACEQLNAKMIKTGRAKVASSDSSVTLRAPKKVVASQTAPLSSLHAPLHAQLESTKQQDGQQKPTTESTRLAKRESQTEHGPITSIDVSAYIQNQKDQKTHETTTNESALRKTESTQVAEDMKSVMVQIELKRKKNRVGSSPSPSARKKSAKKTTAGQSTLSRTSIKETVTGAKKAKKPKLPDGRVSSSAKEKRIKEAIAQERIEREATHTAKAAAEAKEMAELLARLDQKGKEKESIRRRR
jgi:colicin import membrane protein